MWIDMLENVLRHYEGSIAAAEKPQQRGEVRHGSSVAAGHSIDRRRSGMPRQLTAFRIEFGPSRKDILNFTNQLAVMIRAGISLQDALESIAEQQKNRKFQAIIADLKSQIEAGQSFSQALAEHQQVFGNIYVNMVAAAEVSGSLSEMLQKLSEYLSQDAETRSQIKGAMVYPVILALMAVAVTTFLLCFVLPKFAGIFAGKEHLLPKPTKILMGSSAFLIAYWFLILPAIAGVFAGFLYFINTSIGKIWWDRTKLTLPVIKTLCRSLYITRSLHTMGVLSRAGVPILDTVSITAQISGNILYKNMWLGIYADIREGKKIASSMSKYNLMPSDVVQMIRSGEDSGTLSDVLRDVSDYYAKALRNLIKAMTSMIEPVMIVLMGVLVGFIAMSIMLPIFKMSKVVASG